MEVQIEYLKEMGLGGLHMYSRTGMATEYLSDEFIELISACVKKAEKEKMLAWLYDEDRWPSGAAGGLVTKKPQFRARKLVFTPEKITGCVSKNEALKTGKGGRAHNKSNFFRQSVQYFRSAAQCKHPRKMVWPRPLEN